MSDNEGNQHQSSKPGARESKAPDHTARLGKSTLMSPTKADKRTPSAEIRGNSLIYKPKQLNTNSSDAPPTPNFDFPTSTSTPAQEDEASKLGLNPAVTVLSFTSINVSSENVEKKIRRVNERSQVEKLTITIESVLAASKPVVVYVSKTATVGYLRSVMSSKIKIRNYTLYYESKELSPDDSTLESHGITTDVKLHLHIQAQSGTSDKDDINSLLRLSKSLHNLETIIGYMPIGNTRTHITKYLPKTPPNEPSCFVSKKKLDEDKKSKEKMMKVREALEKRSGKSLSSKSEQKPKNKPHRKSRKEDGIAEQLIVSLPTPLVKNLLDVESPSSDSSSSLSRTSAKDTTNPENKTASSTCTGSVISIFDPAIITGVGPVTAKELSLYFDPIEDKQKFIYKTELFDVPDSRERLQKLKKEMTENRCAFCHVKLPLVLRAMPCRCQKVYCKTHRTPQIHSCSVDLKMVDRIKLQTDLPIKASNVTQKKNSDTDVPKGSRRPPSS